MSTSGEHDKLRSKLEEMGLYEPGMTLGKIRELHDALIASTKDYENVQAKSHVSESEVKVGKKPVLAMQKYEERRRVLDRFRDKYSKLRAAYMETNGDNCLKSRKSPSDRIDREMNLCDRVELLKNRFRSQRLLVRAQQSFLADRAENKKVFSDSLQIESSQSADSYTRSGRSIRKPVYYQDAAEVEDDTRDADFKPTRKLTENNVVKNNSTNGPKRNDNSENDLNQKLNSDDYELEIFDENEPRLSNKRKQQSENNEPNAKSLCFSRSPVSGRSANATKNHFGKSKADATFDNFWMPSTSKRRNKQAATNNCDSDENSLGFDSRAQSSRDNRDQVTCPICNNEFDANIIEDHASSCNFP